MRSVVVHPCRFIVIFLLLMGTVSASQVYLNLSGPFTITSSVNHTLNFTSNLSPDLRINHTFMANPVSNGHWVVEFKEAGGSRYLLRVIFSDNGGTGNDRVDVADCSNPSSTSLICTGGCGGTDFNSDTNYTFIFNNTALNRTGLLINGNFVANIDYCSNVTQVQDVRYSHDAGGITVTSNHLTLASNIPPTFDSTIFNQSFNEDTSFDLNLSGNFSDGNGQSLVYTFSTTGNLSISINNATGIATLTSDPDFFGNQSVVFFASDGENSTASNNVTISVLNVPDVPQITSLEISNTDENNLSNGTLGFTFSFRDVDNDTVVSNETVWYRNGTLQSGLLNSTTVTSNLTAKSDNWTVSLRIFDGTNFSLFVNSTSMILGNSPPTHAQPLITSSDALSRTNGDLTCSNQSTADSDGDTITLFIDWFVNSTLTLSARNQQTLLASNFTKHENITCQVTPFDGTQNGTALNSSAFDVQNAVPSLDSNVADQSWTVNTGHSFVLNDSFSDLDGDLLLYNYTNVSNITLDISNATGRVTLTPDTDFTGSRTLVFTAFDGENFTSSNTVTLTVSTPSSSSSSGGSSGSGSGGGSKYLCRLDWECSEWGSCISGHERRKCVLVSVPTFRGINGCPQQTIPEQKRTCAVIPEETCFDDIKNQDEEGVDCGGSCESCPILPFLPLTKSVSETIVEKNKSRENNLTGAVVGGGARTLFGFSLIFLVLSIMVYTHLVGPVQRVPSEQEIGRLVKSSSWVPQDFRIKK